MARIVPSILANLSEELMKDPLAHDESGTEQNSQNIFNNYLSLFFIDC